MTALQRPAVIAVSQAHDCFCTKQVRCPVEIARRV
jgi:hypothetical protein